jgi:hypothetical protein
VTSRDLPESKPSRSPCQPLLRLDRAGDISSFAGTSRLATHRIKTITSNPQWRSYEPFFMTWTFTRRQLPTSLLRRNESQPSLTPSEKLRALSRPVFEIRYSMSSFEVRCHPFWSLYRVHSPPTIGCSCSRRSGFHSVMEMPLPPRPSCL